jgi:hypothetical protein
MCTTAGCHNFDVLFIFELIGTKCLVYPTKITSLTEVGGQTIKVGLIDDYPHADYSEYKLKSEILTAYQSAPFTQDIVVEVETNVG